LRAEHGSDGACILKEAALKVFFLSFIRFSIPLLN